MLHTRTGILNVEVLRPMVVLSVYVGIYLPGQRIPVRGWYAEHLSLHVRIMSTTLGCQGSFVERPAATGVAGLYVVSGGARMGLTELDHLMSQYKWEESAHIAKALLASGAHTPDEDAHLHAILCRSRVGLRDYLGAIPIGERSVAIAAEHELWDKLARALYELSLAYYHIRRYQDQLGLTLRFHGQRGLFTHEGLQYEGYLWFMAGLSYRDGLHELHKAKDAFERAMVSFEREQNASLVDRARREKIQTLLLIGDLDAVSPLLLEGEEYAKARPNEAVAQFDQAYDTCKYLRKRGRLMESIRSGLKALEYAKGRPIWEYCIYTALYETAIAAADFSYALGFALSARLSAMEARRYDLEYAATSSMIDLIRESGPDVVTELDRQYKVHGLDLFQYIPESILHRGQKGGS